MRVRRQGLLAPSTPTQVMLGMSHSNLTSYHRQNFLRDAGVSWWLAHQLKDLRTSA